MKQGTLTAVMMQGKMLTNTDTLLATHVPGALNGGAVLAGASARATAARLEVGAGVEALEVVAQAGLGKRAGLHAIRAKGLSTSLAVAALPVAGIVVAVARVAPRTTVAGVAAVGLARRLRRLGGRRRVREAALGTVVPAPAGAALRGRLVGVVGHAAVLASVPLPVGRAAGSLGRAGRVRGAAVGQAAVLVTPANAERVNIVPI